jgi:hypothetical protein
MALALGPASTFALLSSTVAFGLPLLALALALLAWRPRVVWATARWERIVALPER